MPKPQLVTFREQTTGRINDLLLDESLECAQSMNLLSYLSGALLTYKDEGVEFSPSVVFCGSISNLLKAFPGAVAHKIGAAKLDAASGPQILKDCGPLSGPNWFIFVERSSAQDLTYGVFTYYRLPTALPLHEGITIDERQFCILVRKVSSNTIEMRGSKGSFLTLIFSTVREATNSDAPIERFATACCSANVSVEVGAAFQAYFTRLLKAVLTSSHGTVLICGNKLDLSVLPEMQDAVEIVPLLDFWTAFTEYQAASTAESILNLQRCEELLQGFLRCDGVVVFDTQGRVTA